MDLCSGGASITATTNRLGEIMAVSKQQTENPIECCNCGSTNVSTTTITEIIQYGAGISHEEITALNVPVHSCADCNCEFAGSDADVIRHEAVCGHLGVLTPMDIIRIRKDLGLTRKEFAELTKFGEASLARWENGEFIQNGANYQLLYLLRQEKKNVKLLKQRSVGCRIESNTHFPFLSRDPFS